MGYALLKAKSSKILKQDDPMGGDETAEGICNLYEYPVSLEIVLAACSVALECS